MNFTYYLSSAFRQILRRFLTFICSSLIIAVCMLMVSSCLLTGLDIRLYMQEKLEQANFTVELAKDITQDEIDTLLADINALDTVAKAEFHSEQVSYQFAVEQAQENQMNYYGDSSAADFNAAEFLQDETVQDLLIQDLPPTISIQLTSFSVLPETVSAVKKMPKVTNSDDPLDIIQGFNVLNTALDISLVIMIPCLVCLSLFIIYSFIQMSFISRSEEIQIMSIVGAAPSFIRTPFLIEGAFLGSFGGALALVFQYGVHRLVFFVLNTTGMIHYFHSLFRFRDILIYIVPSFILVGALMGMLCARIALHWLIRPAKLD